MVDSWIQSFKILSSSPSLSFQPEAVFQIFTFPPASLEMGHSSRMCPNPYLERAPAGPARGWIHTLRKAISSAAHLPSSHNVELCLQGGALTHCCCGTPGAWVQSPIHCGHSCPDNGWPPLPTSSETPSSAYQLLDALANGHVPGAYDGLRVMLDQVLWAILALQLQGHKSVSHLWLPGSGLGPGLRGG